MVYPSIDAVTCPITLPYLGVLQIRECLRESLDEHVFRSVIEAARFRSGLTPLEESCMNLWRCSTYSSMKEQWLVQWSNNSLIPHCQPPVTGNLKQTMS